MQYQVESFEYNGFSVQSKGGNTNYTAEFKEWTQDPGIAVCKCSDGNTRYIPSCCLIGDKSELPKQNYENKIIFGKSCTS